MKCPSCGAEIDNNSKVCEYCGSQISSQMRTEQEKMNKAGCPKCHSSNITFSREKRGVVKGKNGTSTVIATVGLCKDCGYTWNTTPTAPKKKAPIWLWVLGWIFIFPLPLTILLVRNKKMKPAVKYSILAVAWLIYLLFIIAANSGDTASNDTASTNTTEISTAADNTISVEKTAESNSDENVESETSIAVGNQDDEIIKEDTSADETQYAEDEVVNRFINEFNSSGEYQLTDISKGNIRTKYFGDANGCYIEMINSIDAAANNFNVTINGGNSEEATEKMLEVFPAFVHVLDPSVSDEDIQNAITAFKEDGHLQEGNQLGNNLTITFVPCVELSWGMSASRIDIASNTYGK